MTSQTAAETVKSVVIIFLAGVAILIGLVILVYVIALFVDRFCCCCGVSPLSALHDDGPRYVVGGAVARDAGLTGMTAEERRMVLERVLISKPYKKPGHRGSSAAEEDESATAPSGDAASEAGNDADPPPKGEERTSQDPPAPLLKLPMTSEGSGSGSGSSLYVPESNATCAICINEYDDGDDVIAGYCSHMFHRSCLLEWLEKHDVCPFCRRDMMTSERMRGAAEEVLGRERVAALAAVPYPWYLQRQWQEQGQADAGAGAGMGAVMGGGAAPAEGGSGAERRDAEEEGFADEDVVADGAPPPAEMMECGAAAPVPSAAARIG